MSGASWEPDPKLTREKHHWVYQSVEAFHWGVSVTFYCRNYGCPTTMSLPLNPEGHGSGICFDQNKAVQLTDREGNKIQTGSKPATKDEK